MLGYHWIVRMCIWACMNFLSSPEQNFEVSDLPKSHWVSIPISVFAKMLRHG